MTSQHCSKCGYPLFEKDGKVICANCTEEEGKPRTQHNAVLEEKRAELLTHLKESKDLNEIEQILRCLRLMQELI